MLSDLGSGEGEPKARAGNGKRMESRHLGEHQLIDRTSLSKFYAQAWRHGQGTKGDSQLLKKMTNRMSDFESQVSAQIQQLTQAMRSSESCFVFWISFESDLF